MMTGATRQRARRVSLCTAAILSIPVAQAQESAEEKSGPIRLEEIVVTATKRPETLQDVPVAVTAITSADIQSHGFTNYADYVNTVPNMWMQDLGPGQTQIYIRGLVAQGGSGFPVATYFGEAVTSVLTNNGGFANMRLVDIDRVEVLRGPQGTLFGANSLAGVLRVVPNAPDLTDFQASVDARGWSTAHSGSGSDHFEVCSTFRSSLINSPRAWSYTRIISRASSIMSCPRLRQSTTAPRWGHRPARW
ncbi:MAG: hypothetical protein JWN85_125 [Gammaproteobacteria bacterium]|nr:hypothetical protein [Gammaproteobacteria bacterium]